MARTAPRLPEQFRLPSEPVDFTVSELASDAAGAHSPYGELEFPQPIEKLLYKHPTPDERPNLADGH